MFIPAVNIGEPPDYFLKFAWTCVGPDTRTVHVGSVPVHAPVQFTKMKPASGDADNVTDVLVGTDAEHCLPQLIAAEDVLTTAPLPLIFTCRDAFVVVEPPPAPPPVPPP